MTYEVQGTFCVPVLTSHLWVTDFSPTKVLSNPDLNTRQSTVGQSFQSAELYNCHISFSCLQVLSSPQNGSLHVGHEPLYRTVRSTSKHKIAEANENSEAQYTAREAFFYKLCFTIHDLTLVPGRVRSTVYTSH